MNERMADYFDDEDGPFDEMPRKPKRNPGPRRSSEQFDDDLRDEDEWTPSRRYWQSRHSLVDSQVRRDDEYDD